MAKGKKKKGVFITFEGGEGSGKSTQVSRLSTWLENQGYGVVKTREPGGTEVGKQIRSVLLNPYTPFMSLKAETILYQADRAQHVEEVIRPGLDRGKILVSDRYTHSSLVYQGLCRKMGISTIQELNEFSTGGLQPDLVVLLDIPFAISRKRMKGRRLDRLELEKAAFHKKVRAGFLKLAKQDPRGMKVIDASQELDKVTEEIKDAVIRLLKKRGLWRS